MTVTIKDVARLSGVSISTVSRVINNSKPVSPEIRRKVLEVIDEIGYKPNEIARTLVTKKSYIIGIIVTNIGDSYMAEMIRGIEEIGKMYNYDILLCSTYGDKAAENKYIQLLNRKQVEGIILISDVLNDDIKDEIKNFKMPFVYLNRYYYEKEFHTVAIDYFEAAYKMTKYLMELGHKQIAYLCEKDNNRSIEKKKLDGFLEAIKSSNDTHGRVIQAMGRKLEDGYKAGEEIINNNSEATAIFCSNDELAIGVINYFYDKDIKVPEEKSVVGYGDIKIASILRPRLTTIKEPYYDIGAVAIRRIIKELKGETLEDKDINLPFQLQKRESTSEIK